MAKSKFIPGPWKRNGNSLQGVNGEYIGYCEDFSSENIDMASASVDMYEALCLLIDSSTGEQGIGKAGEWARGMLLATKAIAKAEGHLQQF